MCIIINYTDTVITDYILSSNQAKCQIVDLCMCKILGAEAAQVC